MLPVHLDVESRLRDQREFALRRTKIAERHPFMALADSPHENDRAWRNLGSLPWYFPVAAVHEQAEVLAEHPEDLTADGQTHQPLIAIRPYGNGQVVYIAFNELWRLRSGVGQPYHQRLWAQMAYRLGMSHPIGKRKRFVVRVEGSDFRAGDTARVSVDAFDEDFRPLDRELSATVLAATGNGSVRETLQFGRKTASRYEADCELKAPGEYRLEITDPVTSEVRQEVLRVSAASREFHNPARDAQLQNDIARRTGGRSYAIADAERLLDDLRLQPTVQREQRVVALWHTPLWFVLVAGLMLSEWTLRRWVHLR
jgi:hypothetical protein